MKKVRNNLVCIMNKEEIDKIYNEDCLVGMQRIPDHSIDAIICDLPYGMTHCDWDNLIPIEQLWEQYNRICKKTAAVILFGIEPFSSKIRLSNIKDYRYDWIWEKTQGTGFLNAKKMPIRCHENISVFYKSLPTYNYIKTYGHSRKKATAKHKIKTNTGDLYGKCDNFKDYDSTERYPRSVITFSSDKQKEHYHPTQKPIALIEYFIRTYTNEGEIVLDNCMGSGTTAIACLNTKRHYIGFEKEKKYYDIAQERIKKHIIIPSMFENDLTL